MLGDDSLPTGTILDRRYKIVQLIKSGGMGSVYKALDLNMDNRVCAIKEMTDQFSTPEERRAGIDRFLSEIQVLESFRHSNIPKVSDHFFVEKLPDRFYYFVMEYIDGTDLSSYLKKYGEPGLPEKQVLKWAIQVTEALEYLHSQKPPVTHRDIKPSNMILKHGDGRIMLIDFGIARVTNPGEGYWIGTPGYAPPEQQLGRPEPRSDFYALGATMHELLSGRRPDDFDFPSFEEVGVKVSKDTTEVISICLDFNPENRYLNATYLKEDLIQVLGEARDECLMNVNDLFDELVAKFKQEHLDPLLQNLIQRYGNEAHTRFLPKNLDYLVFTLSSPTNPVNFDLIIKKCDPERCIHFYEKQGILDKKLIGSLDPAKPQEQHQAKFFIDKFVRNYEKFKSANWGGGSGWSIGGGGGLGMITFGSP